MLLFLVLLPAIKTNYFRIVTKTNWCCFIINGSAVGGQKRYMKTEMVNLPTVQSLNI